MIDPSKRKRKRDADDPSPSPRNSRHPPHKVVAKKPRAAYGSLKSSKEEVAVEAGASFKAVFNHLRKNPSQRSTVLGRLANDAAIEGLSVLAQNKALQSAYDDTKALLLDASSYDVTGTIHSKAVEAACGTGYAAD
jgi:hypothetical protein